MSSDIGQCLLDDTQQLQLSNRGKLGDGSGDTKMDLDAVIIALFPDIV